jgi:hypothetical protein
MAADSARLSVGNSSARLRILLTSPATLPVEGEAMTDNDGSAITDNDGETITENET